MNSPLDTAPRQSDNPRPARTMALLVLGYAVIVLTIDTLAARNVSFLIDWSIFNWRAGNGFDLFKFIAWFVLPIAIAAPRLDIHYFTLQRWKKTDVYVLLILVALGLVLVASVALFPSLRNIYPSMSNLTGQQKWHYAQRVLIWDISWILGWEFLHRYCLLKTLTRAWPKFGWLLIPLIETLYHLQKPPIEALGVLLSTPILTFWAMKRKNTLLPFLAHFAVEVELLLFMLLI